MKNYRIEITEITTTEEPLRKNDTHEVTREKKIYEQIVESLVLMDVIGAVNGKKKEKWNLSKSTVSPMTG